jgi:uncharacterized cupin superfamily protein
VSGVGTVRDKEGETEVRADDVFLYPPNEAHELLNRGSEDFVYYVIADNPVGGSCAYPDSGKWAVRTGATARIYRVEEADYFEGEE